MSPQAPLHILLLAGEDAQRGESLLSYLQGISQVEVETVPDSHLPAELDDYKVVMLMEPGKLPADDEERLIGFVHRGGGCLAFVGPSTDRLSPLFGVRIGPPGPYTEIQVDFANPQDSIARRLPPEFYLHDRFRPLEAVNEDVRSVLTTTWRYQRVPLALCREEGAGRVCCTTLQAFDEPPFQRVVYRLVKYLAGQGERGAMGTAVVGYGPPGSIGYLHSLSVHEVPGLELQAVCDLDQERLKQAQEAFPGLRAYQTADELARDPQVELAIVATPPDSHARLAIRLLEAGKHVVVDKPMSLTADEAQAMIETAEKQDRVLSVYQNRRWDVDYLAIRRAVADGLIGEPFYLETFVGDYSHPCHYWHSHRPISGGTVFDWGAHYVDWILNLFPGPTESVIGTIHKRVWHDVTNADQARVQIRFADGREAEFIHSDVAALRKPKWYLLGTEGAIVGHWDQVTVHEPDAVFYFEQHQIPITEKPPRLILRRKSASGMATQELPLPPRAKYPFYLNLADHLLTGEPLAITAQSAARVVAVLEAAMRSALNDGTLEVLHV